MTKKLLTFLTLLTLFFGVGWAAEETMTFSTYASTYHWADGYEVSQIDGTDFTLNFNKGTNNSNPPKYYSTGTAIRLYPGNYFIVSSDYTITKIELTYGSGDNSNTITTDVGSFSTDTWTGSAKSVKFTIGGSSKHRRLAGVKVTYDKGGSSSSVGTPSISFSSFAAGNTTTTATITPGDNATSTSYKIGEDGTYTAYSQPIEFDLTEVASPITVYAKSSNGTDESTETYTTFTLPTLGVSVSPSSYTGYAAQTVTLTPSNYVGEYAITYTINNGTAKDYTAPFTLSDPGTYEIVATVLDERAEGTTVTSSTATITINETPGYNLPFVETFDETDGTGGNDGSWSGNIATSTIKYDNEGWSVTSNWGGKACIRLGTGSTFGTITSPTIKGLTIGETYTLTFKAAPWSAESTIMNVTASGATVSGLPTTAMSTQQWNDFTLTLTATATTTTLTFSADNKRFFLDEVNVTAPSTTVEDGYYLFGEFNDWAAGDSNYKFTKQSDGSYVFVFSNYIADKQFKFAKFVNGTSTLIGVNNDGVYGLHSTHHTDIAMNTGDEPYKINDSGEMIFTIHADENAFDVDKQVYMKGTYNSWANEAMTLTADGWTITKQLAAGAELGFVDSWGSGIWHGCGNNQNNLTVDQSNLDTDLALWTDGKNFYFPTAGNYSFTVSRDLSKVVISLVPEPHAINCSVVTDPADKVGGTLVADKETAVAGELVTLTINTENGYTLNSVTVNGETITPVNNVYSFEMPNADANVVANFSANTYAITVVSPNGTTTCPSSATTGQNVSFTVTPNENYTVSSVTASANTGSSTFAVPVTEENGTYKFGMPPYPVTVTVTYTQQSSGGTGEWQLVDDASKLVAGNEYIIVVQNLKNGNNYYGSYALSTTVTQNYLKAVKDVELGENYLTATPGQSVAIFTLEGSEGSWMFKIGNEYLYNFNTSKNYLGIGTPTDGTGVFTITIGSNNIASIVENVDNRGLYCLPNVANNIANPYFSLYVNAQTNGVHLYYRSTSAVATPVITPASKVFYEEFDATITCATQGATIYYTTDGTDPSVNNGTPYSTPVHISKTTTLKAIAVKDGESSGIATAEYKCTMVENIAEYNALPVGTTGIVFKNPVIVQYHYISSSGKSYIYVKDDTGCAYFHQPYETEGTASLTQFENGDIIGANFHGDKDYDEAVSGVSQYAMFTNLEDFAATGYKALAEPELKTVSDIIATNAAELNNHYITIKKVKLSDLYQALSYGGAKYFDIYDETGTIGQDHIGYNKFNIDYESVVDDTNAFYNITGIFTAYNNLLEFHPTEVVKWAEKEVTLRDLCDEGEVNESYTITNNLIGVKAVGTSLWVKDENGQSIHMTAPAAGDHNYEIGEEAGNKQLDQSLYDQSNWLEIVFPTAAAAQSFETTVIKGYTIKGVFDNKTNPKLTLASDAELVKYGDSDTYSPNYYCAANFYGSQDCAGGEGHGHFFFMNPKPQEFAHIAWAYYQGSNVMIIPPQGNSHKFGGQFTIDLSLNSTQIPPTIGKAYNFDAIIRMVEPTRAEGVGNSNNYKVYPINLTDDVITAVTDVAGKAVAGVKYYNLAGMESDKPFEGVNIIVTTYTDGSRSSAKVLK